MVQAPIAADVPGVEEQSQQDELRVALLNPGFLLLRRPMGNFAETC